MNDRRIARLLQRLHRGDSEPLSYVGSIVEYKRILEQLSDAELLYLLDCAHAARIRTLSDEELLREIATAASQATHPDQE